MEECNLDSLSHPPTPFRRVADSPKLTHSNSQSESLPDSIKYLSPDFSGRDVKDESVIESPDYTGVEPKATLNRCDDMEESKTVYVIDPGGKRQAIQHEGGSGGM